MITVTSQHITAIGWQEYSTEASRLGLRPGEWPELLDTNLGNTRPLERSSKRVADGELLWVTYRQVGGCFLLRVFND